VYRDKRFSGYDAATVIEVIEHLDETGFKLLKRYCLSLRGLRQSLCLHQNKEYNFHYQNLFEGNLRHRDHRFEWTRKEFETWAVKVAEKYGYSVRFYK